jgi:plastocyanin
VRRLVAVAVAAAAVAVPLAPAVASRHHGAAASKKARVHFGKPRVKDLMAPRVTPMVTPPTTDTQPGGGGGTTTPPTTFPTTRLSVRADEYSLTLSTNPVAAGDALVELANTGEDAHNLKVAPAGGGTALATFPVTAAGARSKERFRLAPGTYEVYCSLLNHRELGMAAVLTVQ